MESRQFHGRRLSVLTLGTVQLGLPYGIANKTGQPSYRQAVDIVAAAVEGGVSCLDTAAVYGSSEEVLGRAMAELGIADRVVVVTKVTQMAAEGISPRQADAIVEASVTQSLKNLKLDRIPICLFHLEGNFLLYAESLQRMKDKGLVEHIGSSVNFPDPAMRIIATGKAAAIQMPTSALDQRFIRGGACSLAAEKGVALFARSIYLQGLLLMNEEEILPELAPVIPVRRALQALAREAGIGLAELAVRYMLSLAAFTSVVVGVDTVEQMRENTAVFARGPLEPALCERIQKAVPDLSDSILFPGNWSKKMPAVKPVSGEKSGEK
jgi:aryl-alcohol dehydrogenase-like predicted oxidoreductase